MLYPISIVNKDWAESREPLGTKTKFWYREKGSKDSVLFKAEERGTGEDWAEKIASELCELLGLPHVEYELAHDRKTNVPGVICKSITSDEVALVHGNELLSHRMVKYPRAKKYGVKEHTVEAVAEVLNTMKPPPEAWTAQLPEGVSTAMDVFVGYVMLDAWIANQDRHHENWGALVIGGETHLAPTFDHGASLARNLSDEERYERLRTKDHGRSLAHFVTRAESAFYASSEDKKPLKTIGAWHKFAARAPEAADAWRKQLAGVGDCTVRTLFTKVPPHRISSIGREFSVKLLQENKRRILEDEEA